MSESPSGRELEGTTRRVFKFIHRQHEPVGIHGIQRGLNLSSPSLAHHHVKKLWRRDSSGKKAEATLLTRGSLIASYV